MTELFDPDGHYELWVWLQQASSVLLEARETELREYGITAMQAAILFIVRNIGDQATPAEIARWLVRTPHSVSGVLQRMEQAGLIRKTKDLHKKNLVRVTITEKGERACDQSLKRKSVHRIISSLSEEERQQLRSSLATLRNRAVKQRGGDPRRLPFPQYP